MPEELLPSVISHVQTRMMKGFQSRTDQSGLMVVLCVSEIKDYISSTLFTDAHINPEL